VAFGRVRFEEQRGPFIGRSLSSQTLAALRTEKSVMTNTQLTELLLARLYELAESQGHFEMQSLNEIALEFGVTDMGKVFNLAKALEGRGLIKGSFTSGPTSKALITGEGVLFVERGGDTGIMQNYRENPKSFTVSIDQSTHFHAAVASSNIAVHSPEAKQRLSAAPDISSLLDAIEASIRADTALDQHRLEEAVSDVSFLRSELAREQPRRSVVNSILATLGDLSSITGLIMQLQPLLPGLPWLSG
jgi:hypothetical protein